MKKQLFMLYAVGATTAAVACLYLVFRRGNAFSPRVKTPKRLRQWTAAFFGILALGQSVTAWIPQQSSSQQADKQ